jgi:hypothetical protein
LRYFVGIVTKQVVERHLVAPLADIMSPLVMARYTDKEIHFLAAEPTQTVKMREYLESKKDMLQEERDAFRATTGGFM